MSKTKHLIAFLTLFVFFLSATAQNWTATPYFESSRRIGKFFAVGNTLIYQSESYGGSWGPYKYSTNGGTTWTDLQTNISIYYDFRHALVLPGNIAIGINGNAIVKSSNNYVTADTVLTGVGGSIVVKAANGNLLVTKGGNVFKSTDNGDNWTDTGVTATLDNSYVVTNTGRIIVVPTNSGLTYSDDNGATFNILTNNLPGSNFTGELHKGIGNEIYYEDDNIYKSVDNGATWTDIPLTGFDFGLSSYVVDVYPTANGGLVVSNWGAPIYKKTATGPWAEMVGGTPYPTYNPHGSWSHFVFDNNGYVYVASEAMVDGTRIFKMNTSLLSDVEELPFEPVEAYPNPTSDIMTVDLPKGSTKVDYKVFNYMGAEVLSKSEMTDGTLKLNLNDLAQGQYILIGTANNKAFKKAISKF